MKIHSSLRPESIVHDKQVALRWCLAAGGCLGLAILTKGLIGIAFVCLSFGLFWLSGSLLRLRRSLSHFFQTSPFFPCSRGNRVNELGRAEVRGPVSRWFSPWHTLALALIIAIVVAAPWYVLMSFRNPGYAYYYFIQRHVMGYLNKNQPHGMAPWWYYLPILLGGGLPWVAYLPASLQVLWARRASNEPADQARKFVWIWLIGCLVFLTLAKSKLLTYMLPLFPAVALLASRHMEPAFGRRLNAGSPRVARSLPPFGRLLSWARFSCPVPLVVVGQIFEAAHRWMAMGRGLGCLHSRLVADPALGSRTIASHIGL